MVLSNFTKHSVDKNGNSWWAMVYLVRLRATLVDVTAAGEKLVAQRVIVAQRPATTLDAPGGVRALTAATDAAIEQLDQWLQQQAPRQAGQ